MTRSNRFDRTHPPKLRTCWVCGLHVYDYDAHQLNQHPDRWYHPECCPECNRTPPCNVEGCWSSGVLTDKRGRYWCNRHYIEATEPDGHGGRRWKAE